MCGLGVMCVWWVGVLRVCVGGGCYVCVSVFCQYISSKMTCLCYVHRYSSSSLSSFSSSYRAVFPDVPEKILPADGTKSVGLLFNNVLRGVGKSQNFAIYMVSVILMYVDRTGVSSLKASRDCLE